METRKTQVECWLEYQRIVDKKSMFRVSSPDVIYVRIMNRAPDKGSIVVREFIFDDAALARSHYEDLRSMYGLK